MHEPATTKVRLRFVVAHAARRRTGMSPPARSSDQRNARQLALLTPLGEQRIERVDAGHVHLAGERSICAIEDALVVVVTLVVHASWDARLLTESLRISATDAASPSGGTSATAVQRLFASLTMYPMCCA